MLARISTNINQSNITALFCSFPKHPIFYLRFFTSQQNLGIEALQQQQKKTDPQNNAFMMHRAT